MNLKEHIQQARQEGWAIGHFNFANLEVFWAIVDAARSLQVPVILGTSEGERRAVGARQAVALVKSVRAEGIPVFLNADHCKSLESFQEAVDAGYDAAILDAAEKSLEENIELTRKAVEYARARNPEMIVEGEIGYIGTSSKMLDDVPEGAADEDVEMPTAEQAKTFVEQTGVDLLAPAVGNLHGMLKGRSNPALDIERVRAISVATDAELVLHGGSGITDEDFTRAIQAGIAIVHINTEIRVLYRDALAKTLADNTEEIAPYKFAAPAREAVQKAVAARLKLFASN